MYHLRRRQITVALVGGRCRDQLVAEVAYALLVLSLGFGGGREVRLVLFQALGMLLWV